MTTIAHRLQAIRSNLLQAEADAGRANNSVKLLAVSKAHPASSIVEAYNAGQRCFGENYLQECLEKQSQLSALGIRDIEWHFIGPIQSNKTQAIAQNFAWVHGVDRLKIAQRLNDARAPIGTPLNICIQVNISGEESKSGVPQNEVESLACAIVQLPHLKLRGLMTIPAPSQYAEEQRAQFHAMQLLFNQLKANLAYSAAELDTLSMGMSDDYRMAIAEGATIVRVGSAIFGNRTYLKGN